MQKDREILFRSTNLNTLNESGYQTSEQVPVQQTDHFLDQESIQQLTDCDLEQVSGCGFGGAIIGFAKGAALSGKKAMSKRGQYTPLGRALVLPAVVTSKVAKGGKTLGKIGWNKGTAAVKEVTRRSL